MTARLRITSAGLWTTIQDLGRPGFQRLGVPVSGALDPVALHVANCLVGNPANTGALEAAYVGPSFVIEAEDARLAFVVADAAVEVLADTNAAGGEQILPMRSVRLRRGQFVRTGSLKKGAILYVAVEGGFAIEPVLGSVSTYTRGRLGGWQGRALRPGDELPLRRATATERDEYRIDDFDLGTPSRLRVIPGPQSEYFAEGEIARFFTGEYIVGAGSDRMGMHLEGMPIRHRHGFNIVSDAIAPGSIQVPGDGQPIILLADRQTTGGYPKIATVISADLPALGRLPIGARISFEAVTVEEAETARRALLTRLEEVGTRMVPVMLSSAAAASRLLECNLISGVHRAAS